MTSPRIRPLPFATVKDVVVLEYNVTEPVGIGGE
jgi:hypothetical protein